MTGRGVHVTFFGVRGSTPCCSSSVHGIGGNTSCVVVQAPGEAPIVLDMGTGIRHFSSAVGSPCGFTGTVLVSHLHWDHVQGLPFFQPLHHPTAHIDVYGPQHGDSPLAEVFGGLMRPPYFPICSEELGGTVRFHDAQDEDFAVGRAMVRARTVPHTGETNGYRIDWNGFSVAYVSDHQEPIGRAHEVDEAVLELAEGVDLLIHDAQFTHDELLERPDWGHCTPDYALEVARQAGARRLALFHHDPWHDDRQVEHLRAGVDLMAPDLGVTEVLAAAEGVTIAFD